MTSPSAMRNRGPIADELERILPRGPLTILEIASGGGEHAVYFAERLPEVVIQPSDQSEQACRDIDGLAEGHARVRRAIRLDVLERPWPAVQADVVLCINMLHASVPATLPALMRGAATVLPASGVLITYGPYRIGGEHTAPSNAEFDAWLRNERNPEWGVRDLETVVAAAEDQGLSLEERVAMPANNFLLVFGFSSRSEIQRKK